MKKYIRKTKKVVCFNCGNEFEKSISEIKRTKERNGNHYCSLKCNGQNSKMNLGENLGHGNVKYIKNTPRGDEFTGFRDFLRRARNRKKMGDLTLNDLKEQWEKQNGFCPYSGVKLQLPSISRKKKEINIINLASLDRTNSTKLYEKGNVIFVSTPINYMKNTISEDETIGFCKKIALFWNKENMVEAVTLRKSPPY